MAVTLYFFNVALLWSQFFTDSLQNYMEGKKLFLLFAIENESTLMFANLLQFSSKFLIRYSVVFCGSNWKSAKFADNFRQYGGLRFQKISKWPQKQHFLRPFWDFLVQHFHGHILLQFSSILHVRYKVVFHGLLSKISTTSEIGWYLPLLKRTVCLNKTQNGHKKTIFFEPGK